MFKNPAGGALGRLAAILAAAVDIQNQRRIAASGLLGLRLRPLRRRRPSRRRLCRPSAPEQAHTHGQDANQFRAHAVSPPPSASTTAFLSLGNRQCRSQAQGLAFCIDCWSGEGRAPAGQPLPPGAAGFPTCARCQCAWCGRSSGRRGTAWRTSGTIPASSNSQARPALRGHMAREVAGPRGRANGQVRMPATRKVAGLVPGAAVPAAAPGGAQPPVAAAGGGRGVGAPGLVRAGGPPAPAERGRTGGVGAHPGAGRDVRGSEPLPRHCGLSSARAGGGTGRSRGSGCSPGRCPD